MSQRCPVCAAPVMIETDGECPACLLALAIAPPDDRDHEHDEAVLEPGTMVGPFRIGPLIGRGGMATVYEVRNTGLDRAEALKVLPRGVLQDRTFAQRFRQEARVVAGLDHPNIVTIYATGIDDGIAWMSMPLLPGGTVGSLLSRGASIDETIRILRSVAAALDYAHQRGIIHRDIKPSNILLDESGNARVADFGVARLMEPGPAITVTGSIVGTAQYMAPEQALGKALDRRCDIYSLGIVTYEMLTGSLPFDGPSPVAILTSHVNEPIPIPSAAVVSDATTRVLLKALAKDPAKRWPNASDFVAALERSRHESPTPAWRRAVVAAAVLAGVVGVRWTVTPVELAPSPGPLSGTNRPIDQTLALSPPAPLMNRPDATRSPAGTLPPPATTPPPEGATPTADTPGAAESSEEVAPTGPDVAGNPSAPVRSAVSESAPPAVTPSVPAPLDSSTRANVVVPAVLKYSIPPPYPQAAKSARIEGDVVLEAQVNEMGVVTDVRVKRSVHRVLDQAARSAVLQYRYAPALRNGIPEASTISVTVSFRMP